MEQQTAGIPGSAPARQQQQQGSAPQQQGSSVAPGQMVGAAQPEAPARPPVFRDWAAI